MDGEEFNSLLQRGRPYYLQASMGQRRELRPELGGNAVGERLSARPRSSGEASSHWHTLCGREGAMGVNRLSSFSPFLCFRADTSPKGKSRGKLKQKYLAIVVR